MKHYTSILAPTFVLKEWTKGGFCLMHCFLTPDDCNFSFCSLLTFLWPSAHPSRKKCQWLFFLFSTSWMLRQLLVHSVLRLIQALSTPSAPLSKQKPTKVKLLLKGPVAEVRNAKAPAGFFGPCPLIFNHMSSGRLSEDDMWSWCGFLINYFKVRQVRKPNSAKKRT